MSDGDATVKPAEADQVQPTETSDNAVAAETNGSAKSEQVNPDNEKDVKDEEAETKPDVAAEPSMLKTTAQTDYNDLQKNNKFDPTTREVSDDPDAIRRQVEHYFGDWNFPQDKFMWETCGGSENKPFPIKTMHSFKRMRSFQPYSAVVAALRDSLFLVVEGEEGEETVKRKEAYKPMGANKARFEASTVYVKGFGDETPDTQFDLESFFANFGEVSGIKLRRTNQNLFKGSVFVTFADQETAKKFMELDPAPKWKDHELKIMSKQDYCEEKNEMIRQGKLEPNSTLPKKFYEGKDGSPRNNGYGGRERGPRDRDDWKKRREYDQKNGFRDRRGGGRGRGRGGRGRGGRDRDHRYNDNDAKPHIESSAADEAGEAPVATKRSREDDGAAEEAPAAKKVDTKEEVQAET